MLIDVVRVGGLIRPLFSVSAHSHVVDALETESTH